MLRVKLKSKVESALLPPPQKPIKGFYIPNYGKMSTQLMLSLPRSQTERYCRGRDKVGGGFQQTTSNVLANEGVFVNKNSVTFMTP
jgi:hypothetical protein